METIIIFTFLMFIQKEISDLDITDWTYTVKLKE